MSTSENLRILVIDDQRSILEDYKSILLPEEKDSLDDLEAELFGESASCSADSLVELPFEVDCVSQGRDGLAKVESSLAENRPYALAFVDMRMPPGWDGLETIQRIWAVDARIQVVICSAYSDLTWTEVLAELGRRDGLWILTKPFDGIEVLQMARALTEKWNLAHGASV